MLTFKVDFDIDLKDDSGGKTSLDTECQLCRSEKQILIHGLDLSMKNSYNPTKNYDPILIFRSHGHEEM